MLTQETGFSFHDINAMTKTVSVTIVTIVKNDGIEIARSSDTRAFAPGQIEDVKLYINSNDCPEITYLEQTWTPEVVQAYQDIVAKSVIVG